METNDEASRLIAQAAAHGIKEDEIAVAETSDGKIYIGRAVRPASFTLTHTVLKSKRLTKFSLWIGKVLIRIFPWMAAVQDPTRKSKR